MGMMTARSVMTDSVVSVSTETSLQNVLRLFVEEGIHGVPVVDDAYCGNSGKATIRSIPRSRPDAGVAGIGGIGALLG